MAACPHALHARQPEERQGAAYGGHGRIAAPHLWLLRWRENACSCKRSALAHAEGKLLMRPQQLSLFLAAQSLKTALALHM